MNRRNFLKKSSGQKTNQVDKKQIPSKSTFISTSLNPYTGWSTDDGAAAHLLRRTMFGAPINTVNYFKTMTLAQSVTQIVTISADPPPTPPSNYWTPAYYQQLETDLANGNIPTWLQVDPAPPVNDYEYLNGTQSWSDAAVPKGMPHVASSLEQFNSSTATNGYENRVHCLSARYGSFMGWWGRLILEQNSNIREKMTLFWHNHFAMRRLNDGQLFQTSTRYWNNSLLRHHALGNFKQLLKAITLDPQMVNMLNLDTNNVNSINENYAREVQELFSIGMKAITIDDGSSFTEDDIHALARLLTGWYIKNNYCDSNGCNHSSYREVRFTDWQHDTGDKQFSSFYNNTLITGLSGANAGNDELDLFLDMLFSIRGLEIGKFLAREIYRFFVRPSFAYDPQSTTNTADDILIEQDIITPLANDFVAFGYEIKPMVEKLLLSEHFFSDCVRGAMIKSPIDFTTGLCRELSIFPATYLASGNVITDINVERKAYTTMISSEVSNIGQSIDNPINVYGWDAYATAPYDNNWLNGATYARRENLAKRILNAFGSNIGYNFLHANGTVDAANIFWYVEEIDLIAFTDTHISNPADMAILIQEATDIFLPIPVDYASIQVGLETTLEQGQPGYWASTWFTWVSNPGDVNNTNALKARLRDFYKDIFTLEEYHLM